MDTKRCSVCGLESPVTEFRWKDKANGCRIPRCKPCDRAYRAKKYDPERQKRLNDAQVKKRRDLVAAGAIPPATSKGCSDCGRTFPADQFRWREKSLGIRVGRCKKCDRKHRARDYRAKSGSYRGRISRLTQELQNIVLAAKQHPCVDCGVSYPHYVMDFDHRDPSQKVANISVLVRLGSREKLLAELPKCDLVCSNCHRARTFKQRHPTGTIAPHAGAAVPKG